MGWASLSTQDFAAMLCYTLESMIDNTMAANICGNSGVLMVLHVFDPTHFSKVDSKELFVLTWQVVKKEHL